MEGSTSGIRPALVPVLHADVREGRTYYVRMVFGAWDERGPRERWVYSRRSIVCRRCIMDSTHSATSAMVALLPGSEGWSEVPEWAGALPTFIPDETGGQAWLDANRDALSAHAAVGRARLAGLRPQAKELATLGPDDSVGR